MGCPKNPMLAPMAHDHLAPLAGWEGSVPLPRVCCLSVSLHPSMAQEVVGAPLLPARGAPQRPNVWTGAWIRPTAGGITLHVAVPTGNSCGASMVQSQDTTPRELGTVEELGPRGVVKEKWA